MNNKIFLDILNKIKEYDTILIDCPPVEIVADTSIIAKNADITLFVIRPGFVKKEFLHTIENYYKERKFNNLAIILNGGDAHSTYRGAYRKEYRYYREN